MKVGTYVTTAPNATPQPHTVPSADSTSRVGASRAPACDASGGDASGTVHAMAKAITEKPAASANSAGKPATSISSSPSAGASACVVSVETPNRPSAAARRVAGAKATASVEAALKAAAKATPCRMRSA